MKKKVRGSTASYMKQVSKVKGKRVVEMKCDLIALARQYSNYGNIPERIGDTRAMEIALLSRAFLKLKETN